MSRNIIVIGMLVLASLVLVGVGHYAQQISQKLAIGRLPPDKDGFRGGPNQILARTYCLMCHSAEYVYNQPPMTAAQWKGIVNQMRKDFGAPLPADQVDPLVTYLVSQNGKPDAAASGHADAARSSAAHPTAMAQSVVQGTQSKAPRSS